MNIEGAIKLCNKDDENNIQRYEHLIFLHKAAIDSCSWDYQFIGQEKYWYKKWMLTDEAKRLRSTQISEYEAKIKEVKASVAARQAEEAKKRFDAYWAVHAKEKESLEAERKCLNAKIAAFNKEIAAIPGKIEIDNTDKHIKKLTEEKSALGLFKRKERKAIQEKIDQANTKKKDIQDRMDAAKKAIESKISPLQARVNAISNELTKAR